MTNSNIYIETGNHLFDDEMLKGGGIPTGKISMIIGKSRQTGKSLYNQNMMIKHWKRTMRIIKIKSILDKIK